MAKHGNTGCFVAAFAPAGNRARTPHRRIEHDQPWLLGADPLAHDRLAGLLGDYVPELADIANALVPITPELAERARIVLVTD